MVRTTRRIETVSPLRIVSQEDSLTFLRRMCEHGLPFVRDHVNACTDGSRMRTWLDVPPHGVCVQPVATTRVEEWHDIFVFLPNKVDPEPYRFRVSMGDIRKAILECDLKTE